MLLIFFVTFLLVISSCPTKIKTPKYESPNVDSEDIDVNNARLSEISDIPIPSKSIIDLEKTFILGKGDDWMGRLSLINKDVLIFLNENLSFPIFFFKKIFSIPDK